MASTIHVLLIVRCQVSTEKSVRGRIELLTDISLSERDRLAHPWPLGASTWKSPPLLAGLFQQFFVFSTSLRALSVLLSFFLLSFRVRACTRSTAPRVSPAPSRVPAGAAG